MKKMFFLFFTLLTVLTGCNFFQVDEECTVKAEYDTSKVSVTPSETTVLKGKIVKIVFLNKLGNVVTEIKVDGNPVEVPSDGILYVTTTNSNFVNVHFTSEEVVEYYTLLVSGDSGLTISPSGEKITPMGQSVNLALVAVIGNFIDSLYIDGVGTKMPYATTKVDYKFVTNDTLKHTFRGVSRKMGFATVASSSSANGTVAPSGTFSVLESSQKIFTAMENQYCSLKRWIVDGVDVNPSPTYTFHATDTLHHTVIGDFVREPEWYICKIKWISDSIYINNHYLYVPGTEVLNFSSNGTYIETYDGKVNNRTWSLDKTVTPPTLYCAYGVCNIEVLTEQKMVISRYNGTQKATYVYHGVPK